MPRSKRDKKVSLTKTQKHGKSGKKELYEKVRSAGEKYSSIYVLKLEGMRITGLSEIRKHFRGSELYLGKKKVMALALGKDEASAVNENVDKVAERLTGSGQSGLLFTDNDEDEVLSYFESFVQTDYARSGTKAKEDVILKEGPLTQFAHSIEPHLRKLGMPTTLNKGVVTLTQDFTVCKKKQVLTPQQCSILKLLEMPMVEFKVRVDSKWTKPGDFKILLTQEEEEEESDEEEQETMEVTDDGDSESE